MEVTRSGQNLLDIAIQATGDAGTALALALANGLCLTDAPLFYGGYVFARMRHEW